MAGGVKVCSSILVVLCMVVVAAEYQYAAEAALTCGQVQGNLLSCLAYLRNGGRVSVPCCNGVKKLNNLARTTPDRQTACRCLQKAASSYSGINAGYAASLPGSCGVNIPYKISPSTDCSRVK